MNHIGQSCSLSSNLSGHSSNEIDDIIQENSEQNGDELRNLMSFLDSVPNQNLSNTGLNSLSEVSALKHLNRKLNLEVIGLQKQLTKYEMQISSLRQDFSFTNGDLIDKQKRVMHLEEENLHLAKKMETLESESIQWKGMLRQKECAADQVVELNKQVLFYKRKIDRIKQDRKSLSERNNRMKRGLSLLWQTFAGMAAKCSSAGLLTFDDKCDFLKVFQNTLSFIEDDVGDKISLALESLSTNEKTSEDNSCNSDVIQKAVVSSSVPSPQQHQLSFFPPNSPPSFEEQSKSVRSLSPNVPHTVPPSKFPQPPDEPATCSKQLRNGVQKRILSKQCQPKFLRKRSASSDYSEKSPTSEQSLHHKKVNLKEILFEPKNTKCHSPETSSITEQKSIHSPIQLEHSVPKQPKCNVQDRSLKDNHILQENPVSKNSCSHETKNLFKPIEIENAKQSCDNASLNEFLYELSVFRKLAAPMSPLTHENEDFHSEDISLPRKAVSAPYSLNDASNAHPDSKSPSDSNLMSAVPSLNESTMNMDVHSDSDSPFDSSLMTSLNNATKDMSGHPNSPCDSNLMSAVPLKYNATKDGDVFVASNSPSDKSLKSDLPSLDNAPEDMIIGDTYFDISQQPSQDDATKDTDVHPDSDSPSDGNLKSSLFLETAEDFLDCEPPSMGSLASPDGSLSSSESPPQLSPANSDDTWFMAQLTPKTASEDSEEAWSSNPHEKEVDVSSPLATLFPSLSSEECVERATKVCQELSENCSAICVTETPPEKRNIQRLAINGSSENDQPCDNSSRVELSKPNEAIALKTLSVNEDNDFDSGNQTVQPSEAENIQRQTFIRSSEHDESCDILSGERPLKPNESSKTVRVKQLSVFNSGDRSVNTPSSKKQESPNSIHKQFIDDLHVELIGSATLKAFASNQNDGFDRTVDTPPCKKQKLPNRLMDELRVKQNVNGALIEPATGLAKSSATLKTIASNQLKSGDQAVDTSPCEKQKLPPNNINRQATDESHLQPNGRVNGQMLDELRIQPKGRVKRQMIDEGHVKPNGRVDGALIEPTPKKINGFASEDSTVHARPPSKKQKFPNDKEMTDRLHVEPAVSLNGPQMEATPTKVLRKQPNKSSVVPSAQQTAKKPKKKKRGKKQRKKAAKGGRAVVVVVEPVSAAFHKVRQISLTQDGCTDRDVHNLLNVLINPSHFPDARSLVFALVTQLTHTKSDPLLVYTQQTVAVLPASEQCLVSAVLAAANKNKSHLHNCKHVLLNTLHQIIVTKVALSKLSLAAFARILVEVCRREQLWCHPLSLCRDLLRKRHPFRSYIIANMAVVWTGWFHLASLSPVSSDALLYAASAASSQQRNNCKEVISQLLGKSAITSATEAILSLVQELDEQLLKQDTDRDECEEVCSNLLILSSSQEWAWLEENLLRPHVLPSIRHFSASQVQFDVLASLYGSLLLLSPEMPPHTLLDDIFSNPPSHGSCADTCAIELIRLHFGRGLELPPPLMSWMNDASARTQLLPLAPPFRQYIMAKSPQHITLQDMIA